MQWHARCTHVQVASATLRNIIRAVTAQLATNTVIIFFLLNGCVVLKGGVGNMSMHRKEGPLFQFFRMKSS